MHSPITPEFRHQLSTASLQQVKKALDMEVENLHTIEDRKLSSPSYAQQLETFEQRKQLEIYYKKELIHALEIRIKKDEVINLMISEKTSWRESLNDSLVLLVDVINEKLQEFVDHEDEYLKKEESLKEIEVKIKKLERAIVNESDTDVKRSYSNKKELLVKELLRNDEYFLKLKNWLALKTERKNYAEIIKQLNDNSFDLETCLNFLFEGLRDSNLYVVGNRCTIDSVFNIFKEVFKTEIHLFFILEEWWKHYYFIMPDDILKRITLNRYFIY